MVMCAVATCSTTSGKDNVAMFSFPKEPKLQNLFNIAAVAITPSHGRLLIAIKRNLKFNVATINDL